MTSMNQKPVRLLGWKEIRKGWYEAYKCPKCGYIKEVLWGDTQRCARCREEFRSDEWRAGKFRRCFTICAGCGNEAALTGYNCYAGDSWFCIECNNLVAMKVENRFVSPTQMFGFEWIPDLQARAVALNGSLRISECLSRREHLVTWLLFHLANEEEGTFIFGEWKNRHALLCMDDKSHLGYLFWSDEEPALRQIFVVKERRREGIGGLMIKYWAEMYAFPRRDKFGIEGPNERSRNLLVKLGFAEREADKIRLTRCYRVATM